MTLRSYAPMRSGNNKSPLEKIKLWILAVITLLPATAVGADVDVGMNYSWWRFEPATLAGCKSRPASVFRGNWIVDQYQSADVRQIVQTQLRQMRAAGFSRLRTLIYHRRPTNDRSSGALISEDGAVVPGDRETLRSFFSDIASAGYRGLEITYGFVEQNSLYCHKNKWGDCFDPRRTDENWRFVADVAETALGVAGMPELRFDLANEGCAAPSMPAETIANAGRYLRTVAARFGERFGDQWLVSCADSARAERVALLIQQLAEINLRPRTIEMHTYSTDAGHLHGELEAANAIAQRLDAALVVGEMRYHSSDENDLLLGWLRSQPQTQLREIFEWPLRDPSTGCGMDVGPPFTPGPLLTRSEKRSTRRTEY